MTTPEDEERKAMSEFIDRHLAFTTRLVRVQDGKPMSGGSGILYHKDKRLFLLSVLHVFERDGWLMETDFVVKDRPLCMDIPSVNWLVSVKLEQGEISEPSDGLAWVEFDVASLKKKVSVEEKKYGAEVSLPIYEGPIDVPASADHVYGFAAYKNKKDNTPMGGWLVMRFPTCELYMEFIGFDQRGYYRFKLSRQHQGHDFYKGSSGAPIADEQGRIVALVQGGCTEDNVIFGVPLNMYAKAILI